MRDKIGLQTISLAMTAIPMVCVHYTEKQTEKQKPLSRTEIVASDLFTYHFLEDSLDDGI